MSDRRLEWGRMMVVFDGWYHSITRFSQRQKGFVLVSSGVQSRDTPLPYDSSGRYATS